MSKKPLTITEQIAQLEQENARLSELERNFSRLCENYFGSSAGKLKNVMNNNIFYERIAEFFNLKNAKNWQQFIEIMCTDNTYNYYIKKISEAHGEKQE